jgi:hypothetical protein
MAFDTGIELMFSLPLPVATGFSGSGLSGAGPRVTVAALPLNEAAELVLELHWSASGSSLDSGSREILMVFSALPSLNSSGSSKVL